MSVKVNFKRLCEEAVVPSYAKPGDAGMDLVATSHDISAGTEVYGTGLAVEIPEGYVGLLFPRSSIYKHGVALANSVGVVDSGYRGEIKVVFYRAKSSVNYYSVGDRVAQLVIMPYPQVTTHEVEELSDTSRGSGGFGSTGR